MFDVLEQHTCRALRLVVMILMACGLGGCGPGTGGTGSGESFGPTYFGASNASICSGDIGSVLGCTAPALGGPPTSGGLQVNLTDSVISSRVQARIQDDAIEFSVQCQGLRFRGRWGVVPGQNGRFYGATGADGALMPASLQVQPSNGDFVMTLRDAQGTVLLGPILLRIVPMAAVPATCG